MFINGLIISCTSDSSETKAESDCLNLVASGYCLEYYNMTASQVYSETFYCFTTGDWENPPGNVKKYFPQPEIDYCKDYSKGTGYD